MAHSLSPGSASRLFLFISVIALAVAGTLLPSIVLAADVLKFPWQEGEAHCVSGSWMEEGEHGKYWDKDRYAIDFNLRFQRVHAVAAGIVKEAISDPNHKWGYGRLVIIEHPELGIESWYTHLNSLDVSKGERVAQGVSLQ